MKKFTLSLTLITLFSVMFSFNSFAKEEINTAKSDLYKSTSSNIETESSELITPDTFLAVFEKKHSNINEQAKFNKEFNSVLETLKKQKLKYNSESSSYFLNINGEKKLIVRQQIHLISKDSDKISEISKVLKKDGFNLIKIESTFASSEKNKLFKQLSKQAYDKAHEKAKLIAQKLDGNLKIREVSYNLKTQDDKINIKEFKSDEKIDIKDVIQKLNKNKSKVIVKAYMNVIILPKNPSN